MLSHNLEPLGSEVSAVHITLLHTSANKSSMQSRQWNRHSCEQESIISKFYLRECPYKYILISTRVAFDTLFGEKLLVFEFRCFQSLCCRCGKSHTSNFSSNCERMGCPKELIKFDKSPMLKQVSLWYLFPLDIPQAAVSGIIAKFRNHRNSTATQQWNGKQWKVTVQDHQVLRSRICKSLQRSADSITTELQTSSGINISTKTPGGAMCRWPSVFVYIV